MNIGDEVVRIQYHQDIVFVIDHIEDDLYYLVGKDIRLYATASKEDLLLADHHRNNPSIELCDVNDMIKGKILHLDGEKRFLKMCEKEYKKYKVRHVCKYIKEDELSKHVFSLLEEIQPDILVLTGHDAMKKSDVEGIQRYLNSAYYIEAIKEARRYERNKDELIIIAGGCQSYYELLIGAGANFASSPIRSNIHALDPCLIAINIASCKIDKYVNVEKIIENTYNKEKGFGGIDTRGCARKIYPRKKDLDESKSSR